MSEAWFDPVNAYVAAEVARLLVLGFVLGVLLGAVSLTFGRRR